MQNIGNIIRAIRRQRHMTQSNLAEDICTIKHLYSIERGVSNPSAEILFQFSNRLSINLFDYQPYLACQDPIEVRKAMERISLLRRKFRYSQLDRMRDELQCLRDFQDVPWSYELDANHFIHLITQDPRCDQLQEEIRRKMTEMPAWLHQSHFHIQMQGVLAYCQFKAGDFKAALQQLSEALDQRYKILNSPYGSETYDLLLILKAAALCRAGENTQALEVIREIETLEGRWNQYELSFLWLFLRAYALMGLGCREESREALDKGMHFSLGLDKEYELKALGAGSYLKEMISYHDAKTPLAADFLRRYPFIDRFQSVSN